MSRKHRARKRAERAAKRAAEERAKLAGIERVSDERFETFIVNVVEYEKEFESDRPEVKDMYSF